MAKQHWTVVNEHEVFVVGLPEGARFAYQHRAQKAFSTIIMVVINYFLGSTIDTNHPEELCNDLKILYYVPVKINIDALLTYYHLVSMQVDD